MNRTCLASRRAAAAALLLGAALLPGIALASNVCGTWDLVPTPNVGNSVTRLTAVTALSATNAWSVGYWRSEPSGMGSVILHWNGLDWNTVTMPGTSHLGTSPETRGVDSTPNGDVWVVGNVTTSYPTNNLPLVLRRRAGAWDIVETVTLRPQREYPFGARGGFAYEVAALNEDDVWAVGLANGYGDATSSSVPLALHWDGSEWTDIEVPLVANRHHELNDLVMISSDDVWAVGDYRNITEPFRGVTYHWDGNEWSHVPSPIEQISQSGLEDIAATGPDDVWAIGGSDSGVILMHWDGSHWSLAEAPPNSGGSLAAVGPDDLWASGWNGYWHWDGVSWTEVPASVPGASFEIRSGGMEIVDNCDIWTVGFWTLSDGITSYTLAERLHQSPSADVVEQGEGTDACMTFPNPFRPGDSIEFRMPEAGGAQLTVHDVRGRVVRRIELGPARGDGAGSVAWDGKSDAGEAVPTGMYFAKVQSRTTGVTHKLLLLAAAR